MSRILKARMRQRVIVTLDTGESFDGVLFEADSTAWVLRNVTALGAGPDQRDLAVDGEVVIPALNVSFCQRP